MRATSGSSAAMPPVVLPGAGREGEGHMEELMRRAVRALEAAGDMDAAADARWLMCAALD